MIALRGISKSFSGAAPALDGVDLSLEAGEIHALLGENGAGKTTLMNVLIGLVRPDGGRIELDGVPVDLGRWSPRGARAAGIAMVHQHSTLVPAFSVAENLAFADPRAGWLFHPARAGARLGELAERFRIDVPLAARVEDLSVGQRQRAEILRALDRGARMLVLDEPTSTLTPGEVAELVPVLRGLVGSGRSIVFISHKLEEIREIGDRVTVLRQGRVAGSPSLAEADAATLGRLMLGRDLPPLTRPSVGPPGAGAGLPAFALRDLSAPGLREAGRLQHLDVEVASGEIVGVAGIDGNGQRELEEVLAGVRPVTAGTVEVDGRPVAMGVRALRAAGVAHLSGDRERAGLVPGLSIAENLVLKGSHDDRRFFRAGLFDRVAARARALELLGAFAIQPGDPDADIATLSGGNAQKVAVARELDSPLGVLVAVNPTRGLDVGSARFVHEQLLGLRARGGGVLLISTELDEVLALADRLVALVAGRLHPVPDGADRATLGAILLGEAA